MILVTGVTGFIGRHIIEALMAQNLPVRCLIAEHRQKQISWDTDAPNAPEVIIGSLLDDEAVFQAVTGVHTIIHLASAQWWGNLRDLERIEIAGTRNLVTVARSARVGRIITLSHLGAAPSSAYRLHRVKGQVEEIIRNSGLAYTILRSGVVFGEDDAFINHIAMMLSGNPVIHLMPGEGEVVLHPIHIDDLIKCIVASLDSLNAVDNTIEIGGPEYVTYEDLLFTIMRVTGMPRLIIPIPPYLMRLINRILNIFYPRTLMTQQWLDILATNRTTQLGNVYDNFGFQPRRFEDTLVTYLPEKNHFLSMLRYILRRRPRSV